MNRSPDDDEPSEKWIKKRGFLLVGVGAEGYAVQCFISRNSIAIDYAGSLLPLSGEDANWFSWIVLMVRIVLILVGIRVWRYNRD